MDEAEYWKFKAVVNATCRYITHRFINQKFMKKNYELKKNDQSDT